MRSRPPRRLVWLLSPVLRPFSYDEATWNFAPSGSSLGGKEYALWIGSSRHISSKDEPSQAT